MSKRRGKQKCAQKKNDQQEDTEEIINLNNDNETVDENATDNHDGENSTEIHSVTFTLFLRLKTA